jgi:hypothetical protein
MELIKTIHVSCVALSFAGPAPPLRHRGGISNRRWYDSWLRNSVESMRYRTEHRTSQDLTPNFAYLRSLCPHNVLEPVQINFQNLIAREQHG